MRSDRRSLSRGILLAFAALALGLAGEAARAQEKFTVVMDWLPSWKHAAFHLAKVKGWYEQAGLDVQVDDGTGSTVAVSQVALGKYDAGLASLSVMAVARGKGSDVIAVGEILHKNDLGLFIDKKLGITSPRDLPGKKLAVLFEATYFPSLVPIFFNNVGTNANDLKLTPMSPAAMIGSYLGGQGDGMITTVPYVLPVLDTKRPSNIFMFADHGLPLPSHGIVVNPKTLERRGETVRKFLAVTDRAWRQLWFGDAKEAVDALAAQRPQANINKTLEFQRVGTYKPYVAGLGAAGKSVLWMPPQNWAAAIKVMTANQLVPPNSKPEDFYTNAYVPNP